MTRPAAAGNHDGAPLLKLLEDELARNAKELEKAKDRELAPYFMEYEATDEHTVEVEGSFGTLLTSTDDRSRSLDVDVRVGTPKLDNTHRLRGDYDVSREFKQAAVRDLRRAGYDLRLAIEDDQRNVAMFRAEDIPCIYRHSGYYD